MSVWKTCAAALVFALALSAPARAQDPAADKIQNFYNVLIDTMKRGPQLGMQGRAKALEPAVDATFDTAAMIQFIVGPAWANTSAADKTALTTAFRRMTIANYAAHFQKFDGEQFKVDPNVQQRGPDKLVQTTLIPQGQKPIPLIYRMRESSGSPKVIDVFLEGYVSELATRRSDFAATLSSGGPSALITKINQLTDSLLNGTTKSSP
ncbi:MAG TPA: ABC transporter substrate-binding protein [Rhizomicrobium sp.]|jgi:phospholipid transport system substrate-binding protein|nr:ABC transporter substrate-binding protein [Rhizomicrobium sp.]